MSEEPTGKEALARERLEPEQVAESAGLSIDDLTRFIEAGVVVPDGEGRFRRGDVASRIAEVAKPGEVLVARSVVDALEPIECIEFEAAGETQLKNISVPVDLFRARRSRID